MGNNPDLTKHFEAILGRELAPDLADVAVLRDYVSVYYQTDAGHRTSREIGTTGNSTKACGATRVLTIGGLISTGEDGTVERLLSEFHCESNRAQRSQVISIVRPATLVATPRSNSAVFVTAHAFLVQTNGLGDVRMRFSSWTPSGDPAPRVAIAWHCLAAYERFFVVD